MIRRSLEWFGGSVLVYVLVAACSASGGPEKMMSPFAESPWGGGTTKGDGGGASMPDDGGEGDPLPMGDGDGDKMAQGDGGNTIAGDGDSGGEQSMGDGDSGGMMGTIMDPVPDADAAEDGTRIVNSYRTTGGGLRAWEGFYDKQLEVPCSFQRQTDGKEYCVPRFEAHAAYTYLDDSCTQPTVGVPCGNPVPSAVVGVLEFAGACGAAGYAPYRVGTMVAPSAIYTKTSVDGACTEGTPTDGYTYYSVGAKIATGDLAEGTTDHD